MFLSNLMEYAFQKMHFSFSLRNVWLTVFIVCTFPLIIIVTSKKIADESIVQVHVLFRHGERTPREIYPTDPYQKEDWPEGLDQLTLKGKTHMYRLGRQLRDRYGGLLGSPSHPSAIHMESSATDRCLMSAEAVLEGLTPPQPDMRMHPDLPWQPVPVHHRPPENDPVLIQKKDCPRFRKEFEEVLNSEEIAAVDRRNKKLYAYLSKHTGWDVNNITGVTMIYDTLVCEKSHGLSLPAWTEQVFPAKLQYVSAKARSLNTYNTVMKRLKGGPFLKKIRDRLKEKMQQPKGRSGKMYLYAGHDQTVVDVVRSIGFNELFEVDFGSCLLFELHKKKNEFLISVFYHNMLALLHPKPLSVPECGSFCSLESFMKILEPVIPTDWEEECKLGFKLPETKEEKKREEASTSANGSNENKEQTSGYKGKQNTFEDKKKWIRTKTRRERKNNVYINN